MLMDHRDPMAPRVGGVVHRDRLAVEQDFAAVRSVDAGEDLDERALARAILARKRVNPPAVQREIDVCQHLDRAESLDDAAHFDGRGHVARSGLGVAHRGRAGRRGPACRAGIRTDSPSRSPR